MIQTYFIFGFLEEWRIQKVGALTLSAMTGPLLFAAETMFWILFLN